jgi:hypothetical protein
MDSLSFRSVRSIKVVAAVMGVVVAAAVAGCAPMSSVAYDRDEPEQRLASMVEGTVVQVDEPQRVIVLHNGQMYRVSDDRAILVNGHPTVLNRVRPGTRVTVVSGTPVFYQNGQYVTVTPGTATVVPAPAGAVVAAPPAPVVTAPSASVAGPGATDSAIRMYGRVTDVEDNGNVRVRLADGSAFEFRPPSGTIARKGDPVMIDMRFR